MYVLCVCETFALLVVVVEGVHALLVLSVHPALFTETPQKEQRPLKPARSFTVSS